jgi:hypothetical protein
VRDEGGSYGIDEAGDHVDVADEFLVNVSGRLDVESQNGIEEAEQDLHDQWSCQCKDASHVW